MIAFFAHSKKFNFVSPASQPSPQSKHPEAIALLERALSIRMKKLGESHPDTVGAQSNLEFVRGKFEGRWWTVLGWLSVGKPRAYPTARIPGTFENCL